MDSWGERKNYNNTWSGRKSCYVMSSEMSDYLIGRLSQMEFK
jgi:hypothetical protein